MFQNLSDRLQAIFSGLTGKGRLTEADVDAAMREIRMALLEADVNFKVVKEFVAKVRERAVGADVMKSLTPGQQVIKIVLDELTDLLGGTDSQLVLVRAHPQRHHARRPAGLGQDDRDRQAREPAAQAGQAPAHGRVRRLPPGRHRPARGARHASSTSPSTAARAPTPVAIAKAGVRHAIDTLRDVVIVDTAGRLHVDEEMMAEAAAIRDAVKPDQILMVVDAMTGQDAVNVAAAFAEKVDFDGVIMSKLDGDARGGAALSIRQVTGKPIKFASRRREARRARAVLPRPHGQAHPRHGRRRLAHREGAGGRRRRDGRRDRGAARKAEFTLDDFLGQIKQVRKMGGLGGILKSLPGAGKLKDARRRGRRGRARPDRGDHLLDDRPGARASPRSSTARAASASPAGPGVSVYDVNQLLKQFTETRKLMKQFQAQSGQGQAPHAPSGNARRVLARV